MRRRITTAVLLVPAVLCCGYCALLWGEFNSRSKQLERLEQEVSRLSTVSAQNEALRKTYAQLEELELLRRNHLALGDLAVKIAALRQAQTQRKSGSELISRFQLSRTFG